MCCMLTFPSHSPGSWDRRKAAELGKSLDDKRGEAEGAGLV